MDGDVNNGALVCLWLARVGRSCGTIAIIFSLAQTLSVDMATRKFTLGASFCLSLITKTVRKNYIVT